MRSEIQIFVAPVEGGWTVQFDRDLQPLMFLSGARAEQQARALARKISQSGEDVEVLVHDRSRTLVGATRYAAELLCA
jgi:hypothetical protein